MAWWCGRRPIRGGRRLLVAIASAGAYGQRQTIRTGPGQPSPMSLEVGALRVHRRPSRSSRRGPVLSKRENVVSAKGGNWVRTRSATLAPVQLPPTKRSCAP
jgi:hypothetical protein